jgi:hypothetical protein
VLPELFGPIEEDQHQKIRGGTASFLGLFAEQLLPDSRTCIKGILKAPQTRRTAEDMIGGLDEWPALLSIHLNAELNACFDNARGEVSMEKAALIATWIGTTFSKRSPFRRWTFSPWIWKVYRVNCTMPDQAVVNASPLIFLAKDGCTESGK